VATEVCLELALGRLFGCSLCGGGRGGNGEGEEGEGGGGRVFLCRVDRLGMCVCVCVCFDRMTKMSRYQCVICPWSPK